MSDVYKRLPRYRPVPAMLPFRLTERDKAALTWLSRFRVMNSEQICRVSEGSPQGIRRRLQRLFHHGLVARHRTHSSTNSPIAYSLARKGAHAIAAPPVRLQAAKLYSHINHELMVAEIGVRLVESTANQRVLLFNNDALPGKKAAMAFRARVRCQGSVIRIQVVPDLIVRLRVNNQEHVLLIEADRGTMPVSRKRFRQSSVHRKLIAYSKLAQRGTLRRNIRAKRVIIAIISESRVRTENIRELLRSRFRSFNKCVVTNLEEFPKLLFCNLE